MKVRVQRQDFDSGSDMAVFHTEAPPRAGEYLRFSDDGEVLFKVARVIYDMERFNPQPDVIVLVAPVDEPGSSFSFDIFWQDETERPSWMPETVIIDTDYVPRVGEMLTIGLVEPRLVADTLSGKSDGHVPDNRTIDVEVVAIAHASFIQQTDDDRRVGIGFGDLQSELQVRTATRGALGDIQRFLARAQRN